MGRSRINHCVLDRGERIRFARTILVQLRDLEVDVYAEALYLERETAQVQVPMRVSHRQAA